MGGKSLVIAVLTSSLCTIGPFHVGATQDVRGVSMQQQGLKVIEEKCLVCHNRQRIDEAVKARKDMEKITRRMEQKGVVMTAKERQVMGHFWQQNPLKTKGVTIQPQQKEGFAPSK